MALRRNRLAQRRRAAGHSQEKLADLLNVERSTVGRWERAETDPLPWIRPKLARELGITLDELEGLLAAVEVVNSGGDQRTGQSRTANGHRADLLSGEGPHSTVDEQIRRPPTPFPQSAITPPTLALLNDTSTGGVTDVAILSAFRVADRQVGGGHLYATVMNFLQTSLAPRLFGGADDSQIFVAAGGFTEMAGWMAHDAGHDAAAQRHFRRSLDLSKMGGDEQLSAHVYASLSHLSLHLKMPQAAIRHAKQGHATLATAPPAPALSARLLAMEARGLAALNDSAACAEALLQAEEVLEQASADGVSPWVSPFDAGSLASEAARCMRRLDRLEEAERQARRIIELRPGGHIRSHAFGQLLLVSVLVAQGMLDEACAVAQDVLQGTHGLGSHLVTQQLQELRDMLKPYGGNRDVADFMPLLEETVRQRQGMYGWLRSTAASVPEAGG